MVLGVLLDKPIRHFADGELAAVLGWPMARVQDAVAGLVRDGLAHRDGPFASASPAAVRAGELL
jgi:hypothetical protein